MVTIQSEEFGSESCFLDTSCSNHMIGHKNWVSNLDTSKKSMVRLVDDNTIEAAGIRDIKIKKDGRIVIFIESVLHVSSMKCNQLSVGQIVEKGFFFVCMKNDLLKVYDLK